MPLDARPDAELGDGGYKLPGEAAELTPVGTIREPYFASVVEIIRAIIEDNASEAE